MMVCSIAGGLTTGGSMTGVCLRDVGFDGGSGLYGRSSFGIASAGRIFGVICRALREGSREGSRSCWVFDAMLAVFCGIILSLVRVITDAHP